jgi:hypothetical protein
VVQNGEWPARLIESPLSRNASRTTQGFGAELARNRIGLSIVETMWWWSGGPGGGTADFRSSGRSVPPRNDFDHGRRLGSLQTGFPELKRRSPVDAPSPSVEWWIGLSKIVLVLGNRDHLLVFADHYKQRRGVSKFGWVCQTNIRLGDSRRGQAG